LRRADACLWRIFLRPARGELIRAAPFWFSTHHNGAFIPDVRLALKQVPDQNRSGAQ
jgi:hypothetical protein